MSPKTRIKNLLFYLLPLWTFKDISSELNDASFTFPWWPESLRLHFILYYRAMKLLNPPEEKKNPIYETDFLETKGSFPLHSFTNTWS